MTSTNQNPALADVRRDTMRVASHLVDQAARFASTILADVAGRRGALHGRIAPLPPAKRFAGPAPSVEVRFGVVVVEHDNAAALLPLATKKVAAESKRIADIHSRKALIPVWLNDARRAAGVLQAGVVL